MATDSQDGEKIIIPFLFSPLVCENSWSSCCTKVARRITMIFVGCERDREIVTLQRLHIFLRGFRWCGAAGAFSPHRIRNDIMNPDYILPRLIAPKKNWSCAQLFSDVIKSWNILNVAARISSRQDATLVCQRAAWLHISKWRHTLFLTYQWACYIRILFAFYKKFGHNSLISICYYFSPSVATLSAAQEWYILWKRAKKRSHFWHRRLLLRLLFLVFWKYDTAVLPFHFFPYAGYFCSLRVVMGYFSIFLHFSSSIVMRNGDRRRRKRLYGGVT